MHGILASNFAWLHHGIGSNVFWLVIIALLLAGYPVAFVLDPRIKARRAAAKAATSTASNAG